MPSDAGGERTSRATPRWLELLRSQGLGVACGLLVVLLLGAGSVILAATREGASARVSMDGIRGFFEPASIVHLWLYLLIGVFALYGLNTSLCTWHATIRKIKAGHRSLLHHGPALMHVAFLLTLMAHLVGGLGSKEGRPLVLTTDFRPLGDGRQARVTKLHIERHANRQPKQIIATVELRRGASGPIRRETIAYNRPLSSGFGARLFLLANSRSVAMAQLSDGRRSCLVPLRGLCTLSDGLRLQVVGIYRSGHWGNKPAVNVVRVSGRRGAAERFFLLPGQPHRLGDKGATLHLLAVKAAVAEIALRVRDAPGNPWAMGAAVMLMIGMLLMGRRWW